jgi:hypothetical protein
MKGLFYLWDLRFHSGYWYLMPCSLIQVYRRFGWVLCVRIQCRIDGVNKQKTKWDSLISLFRGFLFAQLSLSSLKMEVISSSEMSLHLYRTIRRHIPDDKYSLCCLSVETHFCVYVTFSKFQRILTMVCNSELLFFFGRCPSSGPIRVGAPQTNDRNKCIFQNVVFACVFRITDDVQSPKLH